MEKITANEFTNVRDIKDIFLYTKDNYIMAYLQVFPFNLDLLPLQEQASLTRKLAASFEGDRKDFVYFTYPREIDLDDYKNNLKNRHAEELTNVGRRHLLTIMLQRLQRMVRTMSISTSLKYGDSRDLIEKIVSGK